MVNGWFIFKYNVVFIFDVVNTDNDKDSKDKKDEYGYVQFITTYSSSYNTLITRVTTIAIQFANPKTAGLDRYKWI